MSLVRRVARPMLGSMFVVGGIDALRNPENKVEEAESVAPVLGRMLHLPEDTKTLVRINGAVQLAAGTMLALGKLPRLASLALAGSLLPTTWAGHAFWNETDKLARAEQQTQFLKNVSMLGGLLIAAADTGGTPSVAWRARHAGKDARRTAARAQARAQVKAQRATAAAVKTGAGAARAIKAHTPGA